MKNNTINIERILYLFSFFFATMGVIVGIVLPQDQLPEIITKGPRIAIVILHILCSCASLYLFIKPNLRIFIIFLQLEGITGFFTQLEFMGIFFFYTSTFILFFMYSNERDLKKFRIKTCIWGFFHILCLAFSFTRSWNFGLTCVFGSIYTGLFFMLFYKIIRARFSVFTSANEYMNPVLKNLKPGQSLYLKDYGLTDRQRSLVLDCLYNRLTYKQLSEKYNISVSLVKYEFSNIFKIFEVSKLEELTILLLQYETK